MPEIPKDLPAPCQDRKNNPKRELARIVGAAKSELSAEEKYKIARAMNDMALVRTHCPQGFAPLADEVQAYIRPLF